MQTAGEKLQTEISMKQWLLLAMTEYCPEPRTLTNVGNLMGCSRQNVKKLALALEKKGFVRLLLSSNKNDPALAEQVMAKVESFIATNQIPGRVCSHLIVLDENGEIAHFRASSHGGNITGPTEEEQRQFEAEQAVKKKRREEYARTYHKGAWAAPNDRGAAIQNFSRRMIIMAISGVMDYTNTYAGYTNSAIRQRKM